MITGAAQAIRHAMALLGGVAELPHRFGGVEFRLGRRELGHIHGDSLLDIPFPMNVRTELVERGEVMKHHILPESGWVSVHLNTVEDVAKAITLLRRSYTIAVESGKQRHDAGSRHISQEGHQ